jgi:hypothetical protein
MTVAQQQLDMLALRSGVPMRVVLEIGRAYDAAAAEIAATGRILPAVHLLPQQGEARVHRFATECGPGPVRAHIAQSARPGDVVIAVLCAEELGTRERSLAIHVESLNTEPILFAAPVLGREIGVFTVGQGPGRLIEPKRRLD